MTSTGELWVFAGLIVLGQFSPGPDMLLLTRTALREGSAAGVKMALGITCGLALHTTIAVAGVAMAFERFPSVRRALQWAAAAYLLWLAYGLLREVFVAWYSGAIREVESRLNGRSPFVRGFLCNILNPKVALFLAAVCAPFLAAPHPPWWPLAIWGVVVGLGALLWLAWVGLLQWKPLRTRYQRAAAWIDGLFGLALVLLAIRLTIGW